MFPVSDSGAAAPGPKICIDITDLLAFAKKNRTLSGIQRVLVTTIASLIEKFGEDRVDLIFFSPQHGIMRANSTFFANRRAFDLRDFCRYFQIWGVNTPDRPFSLTEYLERTYPSRTRYIFEWGRLQISNTLNGGKSYFRRGIARNQAAADAKRHAEIWSPAVFGPRDRLFLAGATWEFPQYYMQLRDLKRANGFSLYQYLHDLIPIVTPEHVNEGVPAGFEAWLGEAVEMADVLFVHSRQTAADAAQFAELTQRTLPRVRIIPLAHEFVVPAPLPPGERHMRAFNPRGLKAAEHATSRVLAETVEPYALVVGTIEARKNTMRLVRLWKHLLEVRGPSLPGLVLAGKVGALSADVWHFLEATGNVDGKVRFVDRPDDGELAFLYANCQFSLCVSYYEGWGLPIGESLWFGRPVIASRTGSMPEVGGDLVDYVDPTDDGDMEAKIVRMAFDPAYREARAAALKGVRLRTWDDVSNQICEELID